MQGSLRSDLAPGNGAREGRAGVTGQLSTITRSDGSKQATYDGHPLYTYSADTAPGQAKGNGINVNGGVWHEVTANGSAAPAGSSSGSGGGGYRSDSSSRRVGLAAGSSRRAGSQPGPQGRSGWAGRTVTAGLRVTGAGLIIAAAAIRLDLYVTGYQSIQAISGLFLLQVIVGFIVGAVVLVTGSRLAAAAGAVFALATLGGYLLWVLAGLFGFKEVRTTAGIAAGVLEVLAFAVLALVAVRPRLATRTRARTPSAVRPPPGWTPGPPALLRGDRHCDRRSCPVVWCGGCRRQRPGQQRAVRRCVGQHDAEDSHDQWRDGGD